MHEHMFAFSADAVARLARISERNVSDRPLEDRSRDAPYRPRRRRPLRTRSPLLLTSGTGFRPASAQSGSRWLLLQKTLHVGPLMKLMIAQHAG
jgi:hypothetical protein